MVHITALGAFRPHADSASSGRTRTTTLTASSCPLGPWGGAPPTIGLTHPLSTMNGPPGRARRVPRGFQVWVNPCSTSSYILYPLHRYTYANVEST